MSVKSFRHALYEVVVVRELQSVYAGSTSPEDVMTCRRAESNKVLKLCICFMEPTVITLQYLLSLAGLALSIRSGFRIQKVWLLVYKM